MKAYLFSVLLVAGGAQAQQVDCTKFSEAIEKDLKALAIGGAASNRDTNELTYSVVAASNIQSNLLLMQAAKCKLPTEPITSRYYLQSAFDCKTKEQYNSPGREVACDNTKWVRKPQ